MKKSALFLCFVTLFSLCFSLFACGSSGASGLEFVDYSDGKTCYVKSVGSFQGENLVIPTKSPSGKTVTGIERLAFKDCDFLKSVTIPKTVKSISYYGIFEGCSNLESITVDGGNAEYCSVDGILFSKDMTELIRYPAGKTAESYSVPASVTLIDDYAFESCAHLTKIDIPEGVLSAEGYAFANCTSLTSIFFPNSITEIGEYAFNGCKKLTSISVGSKNLRYSSKNGVLYNKKAGAIFRCPEGIEGTFSVPSTVYNVTTCAFYGCTGITEISLPSGVTNISQEAFAECTSLETIRFAGTKEQWNNMTKGFDWDMNTGDYTVRCINGSITK